MFLDDQIVERISKITDITNEEEIVKAVTDCFHYCLDKVDTKIVKTNEQMLKEFNRVTLLWNSAVKTLNKKEIDILNENGIELFFKKEFPEVYDKYYFIKHPEKRNL